MASSLKKPMTIKEVCEYLGISRSTYNNYIDENHSSFDKDFPPRYPFGKRNWRYETEEVVAYWERRKKRLSEANAQVHAAPAADADESVAARRHKKPSADRSPQSPAVATAGHGAAAQSLPPPIAPSAQHVAAVRDLLILRVGAVGAPTYLGQVRDFLKKLRAPDDPDFALEILDRLSRSSVDLDGSMLGLLAFETPGTFSPLPRQVQLASELGIDVRSPLQYIEHIKKIALKYEQNTVFKGEMDFLMPGESTFYMDLPRFVRRGSF